MNIKQIIIFVLATITILYINSLNFDVAGFDFICNSDICEIRHKRANGDIKYTKKIDISKINSFSASMEKIPLVNGSGMVIYANCKDGTRFRLSPIYVKPSHYLETELLNPLNEKIKEEPLSINIKFPH